MTAVQAKMRIEGQRTYDRRSRLAGPLAAFKHGARQPALEEGF